MSGRGRVEYRAKGTVTGRVKCGAKRWAARSDCRPNYAVIYRPEYVVNFNCVVNFVARFWNKDEPCRQRARHMSGTILMVKFMDVGHRAERSANTCSRFDKPPDRSRDKKNIGVLSGAVLFALGLTHPSPVDTLGVRSWIQLLIRLTKGDEPFTFHA